MFLNIENLEKAFKKNKAKFIAFQNINISIQKGEFICILGPSGCGKTTLFNIIAGLEKATSGRIVLNGSEIKAPGEDRAVVFQEGALFPWLTVFENIEFGMRKKYKNGSERTKKVEEYLEMVRLKEFANSNIHELSGGMKQRVAIARALAIESELLLMDEPFSALDNYNRTLLQNELLGIWEKTGKTILFVTHNIEEALYLGDRVIIMSDSPGRIVGEFIMEQKRPRNMKSNEILKYYEDAKKILGEADYNEEDIFELSKDWEESHVLPNHHSNMGAPV